MNQPNRSPLALALLISLLSASSLHGVTTQEGRYTLDGTTFETFIAVPADRESPLPAVLLVHDWMGPRAYFHEMAREIAREHGYAAYVADVYGTETRPANAREAAAAAGALRSGDRSTLRNRLAAALDDLRQKENIDPDRIVAIGFCFGGGAVLELARSGARLSGIVSLHGNLDTPAPARADNLHTAILVLHGDADPYVPVEQVRAFEEEMRTAGGKWELVKFGWAVHSFTDPAADSAGARFDARANRRAWAITWDFVAELTGS